VNLTKHVFTKSDGRQYLQYQSAAPHSGAAPLEMYDEGLVRPATWRPPELRYSAMRGEWVAVSASRNERPFLPPHEYCPLCPVEGYLRDAQGVECKTDVPRMSKRYDWAVFENMFPGLSKEGKTGHCEVILYSPEHYQTLAGCSAEHIEGLIHVWQDRSRSVGAMEHVKQVFIFENKGTEVGVTLHHPHGQLYAFNHVPPFLAQEQAVARAHHAKTGRCLVCELAQAERSAQLRVIDQTEDLIAYIPEAARYPYEVHVTTLTHRPLVESLTAAETTQLAGLLKRLLGAYNRVLNIEFPYIMVHHQVSHDEPDAPFYHWHLEFYPPYRAKGKLKYLAGVESGAGLFINDTIAEDKARELRELLRTQASKP
jgi:UDPglucose--hexose-1-phosphate uridylyltransferase